VTDIKSFNGLKCEFCYYNDTLYRWYKEGLPAKSDEFYEKLKDANPEPAVSGGWGPIDPRSHPQCKDVADYFGFNLKSAQVPLDFTPFRERKTIEEDDREITYVDEYGIKKKELKKSVSMPMLMDYFVKSREDFEKIKSMYSGNFEERMEKNWEEEVGRYRREGYIIWLYNDHFGFFGVLRQLMGLENLSLMFYDDPLFIRDILNFYSEYVISFWDYVLKRIDVDYVLIWEDMAYRQTSLISPAMFREYMLPHYKEMTSFLKKAGVKNIVVDSDGNIESLIPLWIEGGVDALYPMEVQSGMDVSKIRKQFPGLLMGGGIDKKALARTKADIDKEVQKAEFVLKTGGYIPFVDHVVPPDVSWENFKYYRNNLNLLIDKYGNGNI
jgi:hypothetical protein